MNDETYGIIQRIIVNDEFKAAFFIELMRTNEFNPYLYAHRLSSYNPLKYEWVTQLPHKHPLYCYKTGNNDHLHIQPRYFAEVQFVDSLITTE